MVISVNGYLAILADGLPNLESASSNNRFAASASPRS
jgi:hypothetical protein